MLGNISYVPLLKTRVSEVEAYNFLSAGAKEKTFPIFALRPWPNANHLQHSVDKMKEAVGNYPFALALDRERFLHPSKKAAQQEFNELFDESLGFRAYFDFIQATDNAVPVLHPTTNADNLLRQLGNAHELDRGLVVHQQRDQSIPISETIINLPPLPNDTIFVVDAGWNRDALQLQNWAYSSARRINDLLPSAEIVIMSSSFPDSFSHIIGTSEEQAHEIGVFEFVVQQMQNANLTYGD